MKHLRILMLAMLSLCCRKGDIVHSMKGQFNKLYGGSGADRAQAIVRGSDRGYVFAGNTSSNDGDVTGNHGGDDAWIVKVKNDGTIQWQKAFGGSGNEDALSIISSGDGGYVFVGTSGSNDGDINENFGQMDARIVKLGKDGNMIWQKIIGRNADEYAQSVAATSDGYVVLMLDMAYPDHPTIVVKIDKNGEILWQLPLGKEILRIAYDIISSSDGQVIVAGENLIDGKRVGGIAKLDKDGNVLWHRSLEGERLLYINIISADCVINSGDGGYVLAGVISGNAFGNDGWIVKLDKDGLTKWQKTFGTTDNDQLRHIIKSAGGGYIVAGNTLSTDYNGSVKEENDNGWLFKIDESGNMLWQNRYGGSSGDIFTSVIENHEGEYVVSGISESNNGSVSCNHGSTDAWVMAVRK